MLITGQDRMSQLATCIEAASHFLLDVESTEQVIAAQVKTPESVCFKQYSGHLIKDYFSVTMERSGVAAKTLTYFDFTDGPLLNGNSHTAQESRILCKRDPKAETSGNKPHTVGNIQEQQAAGDHAWSFAANNGVAI